MKQIKPRGIKVWSGDQPSQEERQRAHEEFLNSDLKKRLDASQAMLNNGWELGDSRKKVKESEVKRLKPDTVCVEVRIPIFGWTKVISVQEYNRCKGCMSITVVAELDHFPKPKKHKK